MTHESPFNKFLDLIQLDQHIETINRESKKVAQEIALIAAQEHAALMQLNETKQKVHDAQKHVDLSELDMKSLDTQEKEKKRRLESVSNHKEYQLLKSEIDALKKKQNDLEDTLLQAWHMLEGAQTAYAAQQHAVDDLTIRIREQIEEKKKEAAELERKLKEEEAIRIGKEEGIPEEWLTKYRMMRARVTDPVVAVVNGSCSACFYKITEQDLVVLGRNKLIQCKDCYRFLYIPNRLTASTP